MKGEKPKENPELNKQLKQRELISNWENITLTFINN